MFSAEFFELLFLILVANGAPILARVFMCDAYNLAVDFGIRWFDGNYVFGVSKTWRGIVSSICVTTLTALMLGYSYTTGAVISIFAILGDLLSSFIKRRLAMSPSSMAPVLDQLPESMFPALMVAQLFNMDIYSIMILLIFFIILELLLSYILYQWGVRKRPY